MYIWLDAQELQGNYMEKHEMLKDMSMGIARWINYQIHLELEMQG